jgi:hypothetical protein
MKDLRNIGYRDNADICDSAARSGLCCPNCYGTGHKDCTGEVEPCEHKWTGQQIGGNPADAESTEWVEYCDLCGEEKKEE